MFRWYGISGGTAKLKEVSHLPIRNPPTTTRVREKILFQKLNAPAAGGPERDEEYDSLSILFIDLFQCIEIFHSPAFTNHACTTQFNPVEYNDDLLHHP